MITGKFFEYEENDGGEMGEGAIGYTNCTLLQDIGPHKNGEFFDWVCLQINENSAIIELTKSNKGDEYLHDTYAIEMSIK